MTFAHSHNLGSLGDGKLVFQNAVEPDMLAGEVSGLDEGDIATFHLLELGRSHRLENGVVVGEWTLGNGPWEKRDLRLSQGVYILIYEAAGYLALYLLEGLMFEVPSEGIDWRARGLKFAFFRPKDADDKPLDNGTGWLPERSVRGQVARIPDGVDATVRIRCLPPAPNELYIIDSPLERRHHVLLSPRANLSGGHRRPGP